MLMESKAVTMPSISGKCPFVITGECSPFLLTFSILVTAEGTAAPVVEASHMVSPSSISPAVLRIAQQDGPTGTWCSSVRVTLRPAAVESMRNVDSASSSARERALTVSVVRTPSAVATTISSPSCRASSERMVPLASTTVAEEGKHGSPSLSSFTDS